MPVQSTHLIMTDMHFGITDTAINNPKVRASLIKYLKKQGTIESIILAGDILDLNFSTFTRSIEGATVDRKRVVGFREFLKQVYKSLTPASVRNWYYLPGNHDYAIWNMLSTQTACMDELAAGLPMNKRIRTPLEKGDWPGGKAFLAGVFPGNVRAKVTVRYPDHEIKYNGGSIVITHGHYLDKKQTQLKRLNEILKTESSAENARRQLFIETAQYQAIANALSYTPAMRDFTQYLFGDRGIAYKIRKKLKEFFGDPAKIFPFNPWRGKAIDKEILDSIEFYLMRFRGYKKPPNAFIFGHTHVPGSDTTKSLPKSRRLYKDREINIYNTGSFLGNDEQPASFIALRITPNKQPDIKLVTIDLKGILKEADL